MPKGRLTSTSFKPGQSAILTGVRSRPETIQARRVVADAKVAAPELTLYAMNTLKVGYGEHKGALECKDHCGDCSSRSRLGQSRAEAPT
jgi:hypothetical protein